MTKIRIYGASDDLVEITGDHAIAEEYGPGDRNVFRGVLADEASGGTAQLHVAYVDPGVWLVGLAPYDEGFPVPGVWNARIGFDSTLSEYSAVLYLDLPDSATLEVLDGTDPRKERSDG